MNTGQQTLESMSHAVWYNGWLLSKFKKFVKGDVLEVGCGIGNFTKLLTKFGSVVAIDYDRSYVEKLSKAKEKKFEIGFGDIEQATYFFKNRKFDTIVCLNVLEHIEKDQKTLQNLYKLLKPGGHLILLVPFGSRLFGEIDRSIGHFRRYDKRGLKMLLEKNGFSVLKNRKINLIGGIGWWLSSKIMRDPIVKKGKIKIFNLVAPLVLPLENIFEPPLGISILSVAKK